MIQNDLLLRTINGETVERPPIWLMRQAGRILPEYRAIRSSLSGFIELVTTPDLAAEVTVQPVDILGVDAAIIFSDILVIPECMGLEYELIEKKGPFFPETIKSAADVDKLLNGADAAGKLNYVYDALAATKKALDGRVPLIGFAGAPWTLMAYMVEGQGSKTFSKAKGLLYSDPQLAHKLMEKLTSTIIAYLKLKVKHGAEVLQVFDSWAGMLSGPLYAEFCLPYLQRILQEVTEAPIILFAKGAYFSMDELVELQPEVVGLDWTVKAEDFRTRYGPDQVVQGNLDPCVLYSDSDTVSNKALEMIEGFGGKHICNLGHGVYPDTPLENVKTLINTVKSFEYTV